MLHISTAPTSDWIRGTRPSPDPPVKQRQSFSVPLPPNRATFSDLHGRRINDNLAHYFCQYGKHPRMVLPQSPSKRPITAHPQNRRTSSLLIQTAEDDLRRPSKKQKLNHPAFPPAGFWDSLSRIPLTQNALRELNKRNAKDCCISARTQKLRRRGSNYHQQLAVPQRFARHGGPDLRDLRGVCGHPCAIAHSY